MFGLMGCLITTSGLAGCVAQYAGTSNKGGNAAGVFFIFLYLAFQGYVAPDTDTGYHICAEHN